ncbi:transporter substrate-binding domain-containing protein [Microbulbifer sp. OS29]|uniref:Transporter substrate-binding domain-containing protein n=1 Tax=Microbulbifer okhotskensis TaxID=2926617 RepID=A0A9X2EQS0_9GAMM|nr:transporter substrate-binding domain-containing protein [Microbulbifer okhotskensis]MCO1336682.1 transporter substrate-binding domain-containing protein [Microbulbifer okhotskensis]
MMVLAFCAEEVRADLGKKKLRVGITEDIPGLAYRNPKSGDIGGFEPNLAKAIGEKLFGEPGHVELVRVSDKDRVKVLQEGTVDMVVSQFTITPERRAKVAFSIPYYETGEGLLVPKGSKIEDLADLQGKRIAVTKGSLSLKRMRSAISSLDGASLIVVPTSSATLEALRSGNADAVSNDIINLVLLREASAYPTQYKLVDISGEFDEKPFAIGVKKGNQKLLNQLNMAIESLRESGEIDKLLSNAMKNLRKSKDENSDI